MVAMSNVHQVLKNHTSNTTHHNTTLWARGPDSRPDSCCLGSSNGRHCTRDICRGLDKTFKVVPCFQMKDPSKHATSLAGSSSSNFLGNSYQKKPTHPVTIFCLCKRCSMWDNSNNFVRDLHLPGKQTCLFTDSLQVGCIHPLTSG